jgi:hypothetical protein
MVSTHIGQTTPKSVYIHIHGKQAQEDRGRVEMNRKVPLEVSGGYMVQGASGPGLPDEPMRGLSLPLTMFLEDEGLSAGYHNDSAKERAK